MELNVAIAKALEMMKPIDAALPAVELRVKELRAVLQDGSSGMFNAFLFVAVNTGKHDAVTLERFISKWYAANGWYQGKGRPDKVSLANGIKAAGQTVKNTCTTLRKGVGEYGLNVTEFATVKERTLFLGGGKFEIELSRPKLQGFGLFRKTVAGFDKAKREAQERADAVAAQEIAHNCMQREVEERVNERVREWMNNNARITATPMAKKSA